MTVAIAWSGRIGTATFRNSNGRRICRRLARGRSMLAESRGAASYNKQDSHVPRPQSPLPLLNDQRDVRSFRSTTSGSDRARSTGGTIAYRSIKSNPARDCERVSLQARSLLFPAARQSRNYAASNAISTANASHPALPSPSTLPYGQLRLLERPRVRLRWPRARLQLQSRLRGRHALEFPAVEACSKAGAALSPGFLRNLTEGPRRERQRRA